jgi:site-specific recombinase XerD
MIKITKLPPGKAIGAEDLQNWSRQRNAGRSGTRDDLQQEKRLHEQKRRREKWLRKHRRKYLHPHMLRHSCGYKLANDGVDTRTIQSYLGHKSIQHTVRYTELAPTRFKSLFRD